MVPALTLKSCLRCWRDRSPHLLDPGLQRSQLLGVFVAGLVVSGNGSGDSGECKARGERIGISGGLGQFTGGGSIVQVNRPGSRGVSQVGTRRTNLLTMGEVSPLGTRNRAHSGYVV